jgi:hypothetical protein
MASAPGALLPTEEYERRKAFLDGIRYLTKAECIEVLRIMQKHNVAFSENANGVFFNVVQLEQSVFDALELFLQFTQSNRKNLEERELFLSTLAKTVAPATASAEKIAHGV